MQSDIEEQLEHLVGLELTFTRRVGMMQCFEFGPQMPAVNHKGEPITIAHNVLHVQCPWRIVRDSGILVGSLDIMVPRDETVSDADLERRTGGASLRDAKMDAIREFLPDPGYVIVSVQSNRACGLAISFVNDCALEVFPAGSTVEDEAWRLMRPDMHIIISGTGLESPLYTGPDGYMTELRPDA